MSALALLRRRRWWRYLADRRGNAAIELALLAPPLTLMLVGTADYGLGLYRQMQVQNAAQAGAEYALKNGFSPTAIGGAVTSATPLGVSASPAPVESCGCPTGTAISSATCNSTCANGQKAGVYVTVGAQTTYTTIIPYPGIPNSYTLTASSTVRIQ
jgi:Flp pilus assembly protein TadG